MTQRYILPVTGLRLNIYSPQISVALLGNANKHTLEKCLFDHNKQDTQNHSSAHAPIQTH